MANWTKVDLTQNVLERIGIVGAGESPAAEDTNLVTGVVESVYDQLRKEGLVPFAVSSIPDWAKQPLSKVASYEAKDYFGIGGQRAQILAVAANEGRRELARQVAGHRRKLRIRARYY